MNVIVINVVVVYYINTIDPSTDTEAAPAQVRNTAGSVDRAKIAFGSNYPKLQQIKKKYDPENVFNRWFPIIPAA